MGKGEEEESCPLCWALVPRRKLPAHIRAELHYSPWSCALCRIRFFDHSDALNHFDAEFSRHPGSPPQILEQIQPDLERRVISLTKYSIGAKPQGSQVSELADRPPSPKAEQRPEDEIDIPEEKDCRLVIDDEECEDGVGAVSPTGLLPPQRRRRSEKAELSFTAERLFCNAEECLTDISAGHWRSHVARHHLREPVHRCLLCGWQDCNWATAADMKRHLRVRHQISRAGPAHYQDFRPYLQDRLRTLRAKYISVCR